MKNEVLKILKSIDVNLYESLDTSLYSYFICNFSVEFHIKWRNSEAFRDCVISLAHEFLRDNQIDEFCATPFKKTFSSLFIRNGESSLNGYQVRLLFLKYIQSL